MLRTIFYIFLYIFLTGCIIFLFVKDQLISDKLEKIRAPFFEKIYNKYKINKKSRNKIEGLLDWIQMIVIVLIIVAIIQLFYIGNYTVPTGSMEPTIIPGERFFAEKISYRFREPQREEVLVFREPYRDRDRYTKRLVALPGEFVKINNNNLYINNNEIEINEGINYYNFGTLISNNEWKVPQKGDYISIESGTFEVNNIRLTLEVLREMLRENQNILDNEIFIHEAVFILNQEHLTGPIYDRDILYNLIKGEEVLLENDYYFTLGDNSRNSYDSRTWGFVSQDRIIARMGFRFWPINRIGLIK
ncbi:signal peptidase I [Natronospora cellulosivora (SeqCode)]